MPTDVETLMEMGFPKHRAQRALAKSGYKGAQVAMDWLFAHENDPDIDDPFEEPKGHSLNDPGTGDTPQESASSEAAQPTGEAAEATSEEGQVARSLKCDDCGKLLKSSGDAEMHAARTQHTNFSESVEEIKPLTEEEKKQKLLDLQEKMKQKRVEKEQQEKREQIQREKQRRVHGKEMVSSRAKMEELEMRKLAEQRRKEKEDDRRARQRVKEQIEKDKRDRAAKFGKSEESKPVATTSTPAAAVSPPQPAVKKEYDQCRLQIRLTNGQALTQSFGSKEPLAAVRLYVEMNRTDGASPFVLMTTFPRKVFAGDDMDKPLSELGLVPSAVLVVTKPQ